MLARAMNIAEEFALELIELARPYVHEFASGSWPSSRRSSPRYCHGRLRRRKPRLIAVGLLTWLEALVPVLMAPAALISAPGPMSFSRRCCEALGKAWRPDPLTSGRSDSNPPNDAIGGGQRAPSTASMAGPDRATTAKSHGQDGAATIASTRQVIAAAVLAISTSIAHVYVAATRVDRHVRLGLPRGELPVASRPLLERVVGDVRPPEHPAAERFHAAVDRRDALLPSSAITAKVPGRARALEIRAGHCVCRRGARRGGLRGDPMAALPDGQRSVLVPLD